MEKQNRIIGIVSGKGGVGKSMAAVNLATSLTKMGKSCILVDADLSNPSVSLHLGLSYMPIGLQDLLTGKNKVSDAIVIQPTFGLRVIPSSLRYRKEGHMRNLKSVLNSLNAYDFVLVDSPPGITDDVMDIIEACGEVVIMTTPDVPGVTSAAKICSLCAENRTRVTGIVVNRVTNARYELLEREIESMTEKNVLVEIPEDPHVPASISARIPVVLYNADCKAAKSLKQLAYSLGGERMQIAPLGFLGRITLFFNRLLGRD